MKSAFLLAFAALFLIAPAEAAQNNKEGNKAAEKAAEKKKQKEADRAERAKKREGVDAVLDMKDKNKDGSLDPDEYLIGESDVEAAKARFKEFNKTATATCLGANSKSRWDSESAAILKTGFSLEKRAGLTMVCACR